MLKKIYLLFFGRDPLAEGMFEMLENRKVAAKLKFKRNKLDAKIMKTRNDLKKSVEMFQAGRNKMVSAYDLTED